MLYIVIQYSPFYIMQHMFHYLWDISYHFIVFYDHIASISAYYHIILVLYCIVLCYTTLHYIVLFFISFHFILLNFIIFIILYFILLS